MTAGKNSDYAAGKSVGCRRHRLLGTANFGLGDQAARRDARSAFDQTHWRQIEVMDRISREVTEADIQVRSRRDQIANAGDGVKVAARSYQLNIDRMSRPKACPSKRCNRSRRWIRRGGSISARSSISTWRNSRCYGTLGWPAGAGIANQMAPAWKMNRIKKVRFRRALRH